MVTRFRRYFFGKVLQCRIEKPIHSTIMPKRSLQNPPEKKLKKNLTSINSIKNTNFSIESSADMVIDDKIQNESQEKKCICDTKKPHTKATYLETPIKSENDKKEYRVIQLENGLTALLIADLHSLSAQGDCKNNKENAISSDSESEEETDDEEDGESSEEESDDEDELCDKDANDSSERKKIFEREEKMAACGLSIGVGSFSDPPEIPGLAHFLEHMVFMGSEKYTEENDFDVFIKKKGGSDNASTECELTTFYFEIQEKYLFCALDRFAQFFIKPLMKKDAITREREAVESEFQMALPSDFCRKEQLFCSFARPNHPATKFCWGNLITLKDNVTDDKLYEELHRFRERHYSAHRMKLSIQARLPLDVLEDYVTQCFADVPNNNLPPDDFTLYKGADSFDTTSFRKIYKVKPIKDVCQIELTWSMPPLHHLYKSKPHQYVSWIIEYEGKGSLISYLRRKMWCLALVGCGNGESGFEHSSMYALFSLSLTLTDQGRKHLPEILNAIFSFINLVRKEGPQKRIYDEIHQITEMNFRFAEESPPADYVEELCENMHYYPPNDYITGSELYFEYNPEAIEACLNYLTPDNVNIMFFDKKFDEEEFDKVEPWFNTKYTAMEIPQEWIDCWKTIEPLPEFHLPLPNVFITDDFTLVPIPPDVSKYPTKIYSDEITEIWYRPDPKFSLPECYMFFSIISPAVSSLKCTAFMDLFVIILNQLLVEALYPATVAELNHQIGTNEKGITIKVNGYNQKLPLLLISIAKCIADSPTLITKELFEVMKEEQTKIYYNDFVRPKKLARHVRLSILMLTHWTSMDRHDAICNIDFHEFLCFIKYLTDHVYIKSLVQGNMTKEDVIKNIQEFVKTLKCGPLLPNTMPVIRITQIPIGSQYCKVKNFNDRDVNSIVMNYYQSGVSSLKLSVIIELLIMIMEEPLFNQLRTQEQLGYDVLCMFRDTYGVLGYSITVCTQADKYSTEHVDNRIEAFLEMFNNILSETSEKELDGIKDSLIKLKQCTDIHLKEEVERNWDEIVYGKYMFDRIERELKLIPDIEIDELREWMKSHTINGSNLRKLSIHVAGSANTSKENNEKIEPRENFKTETNGNVKYSFVYLPTPEEKSWVYITNVEDYKNQLYCYSVITS